MGSSSDKEMPTLAKLFEDEIIETNEAKGGEARDRAENIRVSDVPSDISEGELLAVSIKYDLGSEYKLTRPRLNVRANAPLDDEESMILYEEDLHSGVWFPLSEPLRSFFNKHGITVSQLHPNGLRLLCGIAKLEHRYGTTLTASSMDRLYRLQHRLTEDHCFLQARKDCNLFYKSSEISSLKNWKHKFFIIHQAGGFGVPTRCGLRTVNLKQIIAEGYQVRPYSGPIGPQSFISDMVPKKSKGSKLAKVAEAMKKKVVA
ncbi:hypothetical protein JCGZ_13699 [Jatropha curcas]|uniref:Uncharacterized protein n=1 Tax=Jatropha curcas TaxID=180498 RepID=A0A067KD17_JATCU|nr:hypothetical protein JCGZ_13699 [Jatropha curcas]